MTDKLHRRWALAGAMVAIGVPYALPGAPADAATVAAPAPHLSVRVFASGSATMFQPDDITWLDGTVYAVWQNGVGPTGLPSPTGATTSTVTGYSTTGHRVGTWKVAGHADGLAADTASHRLIVTVNEDGNSSLFAISPEAPAGDQVRHYQYNLNPLAHGGGTDAVSIYRGVILVSASNQLWPTGRRCIEPGSRPVELPCCSPSSTTTAPQPS